MQALINILFVSISLSLNNFAVAIAIGLSGADRKTRIRTAVAFGLFEAIMPIVGILIGQRLAGSIGQVGKYVGGGLLVLTGAYNTWQSTQEQNQVTKAEQPKRQNFKYLLFTGFALSIDNLVVGFALSLYDVPLILAAGMIAFTSITMSLVGLEFGQRLGAKFERWSEVTAGVILILVGLALGFGLL